MHNVRTKTWLARLALALMTVGLHGSAAKAQTDCGCSPAATQGYHLPQDGQSPCDQGCGSSGTLFSRLRNAVRCDSKYRPGLWDGYCDERVACDRTHQPVFQGHFGGGRLLGGCKQGCGPAGDDGCSTASGSLFGGGLFGGKSHCGSGGLFSHGGRHGSRRLFHFPQAAGCGSGAYGLPNEADCGCGTAVEPTCAAAAPSDCGNGCDDACGCGSIFGIKHSCFRNDGHFFGCFSRHGHRWGSMFSGSSDCGGGLFGKHHRRQSFGSLGCGHCQNAVPVAAGDASCGTDSVPAAHAPQNPPITEGNWAPAQPPAPVSAE
jgi:hypothetical protein